ncbi:hypothetical protein [Azospirillum argentinense]|uniref:hypothetical protein n=1 Tax=Azospirillum argentinense TaxID=2970906 RepID=UPI0032DF9676
MADIDRLSLVGLPTSQLATVAGLDRELLIDTTKRTVTVHDGVKAGGYPLLREDGDGSAVAVTATGGGAATLAERFRRVDSIAALRTISTATANGLASVMVTGYWAAADGGGGLFVWDGSSIAADDAGVIIRPTGSVSAGRWRRVIAGDIDPKWYGAKADWNHDLQQGSYNEAAFQAAIDSAAARGLNVVIAAGRYGFSASSVPGKASISIPGGVKLYSSDPASGRTTLYHARVEAMHAAHGDVGPLVDLWGRAALEGVSVYCYSGSMTAPVVSRPTLRLCGAYPRLSNIRFHYPFVAVGTDVAAGAYGCVIADGIYGYFHHRMFYLEDTADGSILRNLHSNNPDGVPWPEDYSWYGSTNRVLVECNGADGILGENWFAAHGKSLIRVATSGGDPDGGSGSGYSLSVSVTSAAAEGMLAAIDVQATGIGPESTITLMGGSLQTNNRPGGACVVNMEGTCHLRLVGMALPQSAGATYVRQGGVGTVRLSECLIDGMDAVGSAPGNGSMLLKLLPSGTGTVDFDGCLIRNFTKLVDDPSGRRAYGFNSNCRASGIVSVGDLSGYLIDAGGLVRPSVVTAGTGTAAAAAYAFNGDADTGLFAPGADTLALSTGGAERARVDSAGNLIVGGLSSIQPGTAPTYRAGALQVRSAGAGVNAERYATAGSSPPALYLAKSNHATLGWHGAVSDGTITGEIQFHGSDGAKFIASAAIRSMVDGTPGTDDMPGRIVFLTTPDGGTVPAERFRIDNTGALTHRGGATVIVDANSHLGLRPYTVATLPSAATSDRLISVSNGSSNRRLAISDGTNWRWPDGTIVS